MDVHKSSVLAIFDAKQRLEVPLFQRQYVWHEEQQWLPLWEDIERKFSEALDGRNGDPIQKTGSLRRAGPVQKRTVTHPVIGDRWAN
jgi:hypothetical protein